MNYSELKKSAQMNQAFSLSSDLDVFTHHFPGSPLLPGALSALLLAETFGGSNWTLKKINGFRLRKPLLPNGPVSMTCTSQQETETQISCTGKIFNGADTFADGEFVFEKSKLAVANGSTAEPAVWTWTAAKIREYLPHGEPIVLIDQLVSAIYPQEILDLLAGPNAADLDQTKLVGTKVHTRSKLSPGNFWLNQGTLPSPVLSELVAQAAALTLAPFFTGTKPQVSLLGCDTEYFALAGEGSTIDTFVELTRAKRLGQSNMMIFKSECRIGDTKIASVNLNAMATFEKAV